MAVGVGALLGAAIVGVLVASSTEKMIRLGERVQAAYERNHRSWPYTSLATEPSSDWLGV